MKKYIYVLLIMAVFPIIGYCQVNLWFEDVEKNHITIRAFLNDEEIKVYQADNYNVKRGKDNMLISNVYDLDHEKENKLVIRLFHKSQNGSWDIGYKNKKTDNKLSWNNNLTDSNKNIEIKFNIPKDTSSRLITVLNIGYKPMVRFDHKTETPFIGTVHNYNIELVIPFDKTESITRRKNLEQEVEEKKKKVELLKAEVEQIKKAAEVEAEQIKEEAEVEAEQIKGEAEVEAEQIKEEAIIKRKQSADKTIKKQKEPETAFNEVKKKTELTAVEAEQIKIYSKQEQLSISNIIIGSLLFIGVCGLIFWQRKRIKKNYLKYFSTKPANKTEHTNATITTMPADESSMNVDSTAITDIDGARINEDDSFVFKSRKSKKSAQDNMSTEIMFKQKTNVKHSKPAVSHELNLNHFFKKTVVSKVNLSQEVIVDIDTFVSKSKHSTPVVEVVGFLMGTYDKVIINGKEKYNLKVEKFIPSEHVDFSSNTQVAVGGAAMIALSDAQEKYKKLATLGWFHTHPGHGVFLSSRDLDVQAVFNEAFQVAAVLDPIRDQFAVFSYKSNTINAENNLNTDIGSGKKPRKWSEFINNISEVKTSEM